MSSASAKRPDFGRPLWILSHRAKLAFPIIYKNASTTLKRFCLSLDGIPAKEDHNVHGLLGYHPRAHPNLSRFQDVPAEYQKIVVLRDPILRIASAWKSKACPPFSGEGNDASAWFEACGIVGASLPDFIRWIPSQFLRARDQHDIEPHIRPQASYLEPAGTIPPDTIPVRLSGLSGLLEAVCGTPLPVRNHSGNKNHPPAFPDLPAEIHRLVHILYAPDYDLLKHVPHPTSRVT